MAEPRRDSTIRSFADRIELWVRGKLWLQVVIALVAGIVVGTVIGPDLKWVDPDTADAIGRWLALPGKIFLGLITLVLEPLVFASIIQGLVGSSSGAELKRVGTRMLVFVVATTVLAAAIGLVLAKAIEPGKQVAMPAQIEGAATTDKTNTVPAKRPVAKPVPDYIVGLIPTNPTKAILDRDLLAIVVIAVLLGLAARQAGREQAEPFIKFMGALLSIAMAIVRWAMMLTPWAVFGLMAQAVSKVGLPTLVGLGTYCLTVLVGLLLIYALYLLLILIVARQNPWTFARNIASVQLLAFSTSSSAAVMPVTIETAVSKLKVPERIASVVVPLGATINMAGTALYQAIAVMFLAQIAGVDLSGGDLALIVITLVAASIGAPGTPGISIVILSTVVAGFGIPTTGLILILGVDRILDMSRTVVNVTGDLTACVLIRGSGKAPAKTASPQPATG
ncbi:MAG: dicarboxylate/amino acid:cation symporter [Alphaproteobacteria bacterium]